MKSPPKHVRFTHTPLNFKNKEIRLIKIQPSSDPSSPIEITIQNVEFGGHNDALTRFREEMVRKEAREKAEEEARQRARTEALESALESAKAGSGDRAREMASPARVHSFRPFWESRKDEYDRFFQETLDFIALSYTWGPEFPVQDILVTSPECRGWLSVRQNLYDFLKTRRECDSAWFWIDQICINQGKNDEKTHQVNQMADIYSSAAVEVWLGPGFDGSDKFMDMMVCRSFYLPDHLSRFGLDAVQLGWRRSFLRLPYWSRLWVLQEIILGNTVTIRIGSKTISWDKFYKSWVIFESLVESLALTGTDNYLTHISARINRIHDRRSGKVEDQGWWGIASLVQGAECSDPRDRVFGALGIVRPWLRLTPDYSRQPEGILLELLTKEVEFRTPEMDHARYPSRICAQGRRAVVNTAKWWLLALDDNKNLIDPKSVRRHLLEVLPLDPPVFVCRVARTWQLKCYIWKGIPNDWSIYSRLAHAGVQRVEPLARGLKRLLQYPKDRWGMREVWVALSKVWDDEHRIHENEHQICENEGRIHEKSDASLDNRLGALYFETSPSVGDLSHHIWG